MATTAERAELAKECEQAAKAWQVAREDLGEMIAIAIETKAACRETLREWLRANVSDDAPETVDDVIETRQFWREASDRLLAGNRDQIRMPLEDFDQ